jgi:hypothetical protein
LNRLFDLCTLNIIEEDSDLTSIVKDPYKVPVLGSLRRARTGSVDCPIETTDSVPANTMLVSDGLMTIHAEELPKMGLAKLYWRAAVLSYLLGCARPDSIGNFVWQNVATVRALMLMAISDRTYFVPICDLVHSVSSPDAISRIKSTRIFDYNGTDVEISPDGLRVVKKGHQLHSHYL